MSTTISEAFGDGVEEAILDHEIEIAEDALAETEGAFTNFFQVLGFFLSPPPTLLLFQTRTSIRVVETARKTNAAYFQP